METNLTRLENQEEAWIEKYRAALAANNTPQPQSRFKKFRTALSGVHDNALARVNKSLDRWVRAHRVEEKQDRTPKSCEQPGTEVGILVEGMKRVESFRRQSGKKAQSTTAWPRPAKPTEHIA
jgi:hypothetical protein